MATLTLVVADLDGTAPSLVAATGGGDQFANDGHTVLHVVNGGGAGITVTVDSQVNCNQGYDHNSVTTVGAGAEAYIGPFPTKRFNDATGYAQVTYSGVTSVTVEAVQVS